MQVFFKVLLGILSDFYVLELVFVVCGDGLGLNDVGLRNGGMTQLLQRASLADPQVLSLGKSIVVIRGGVLLLRHHLGSSLVLQGRILVHFERGFIRLISRLVPDLDIARLLPLLFACREVVFVVQLVALLRLELGQLLLEVIFEIIFGLHPLNYKPQPVFQLSQIN